MTALTDIDSNTIVALGSLGVAALGLIASLGIFRYSYSQNVSFKMIDIEREDIREIQENAALFLRATTEKFKSALDIEALNKKLELEQRKFNPDTVRHHDQSGEFEIERTNCRKNSRDCLFDQLLILEKMRFLIDESEAKHDDLISLMGKMISLESLKETKFGDFSDLINQIILNREKEYKKRIGLR